MLNSVIQGDCLEVMRGILDGSVDMILCDLPYGTTACKWDSVIPFESLWAEYKRIIKANGAIVLTASQPFTSALVMSNPRWFRHEWVWIKDRGSNFANTVREPMKEHETVLVFSPGKWTYNKQMQERSPSGAKMVGQLQHRKTETQVYNPFNGDSRILPKLRVPSSWQKFNRQTGLHPTQKPVALFEYLIKTYTNPGETVLDNCLGSGTTAVACINTGRNFIGIEREPKYVEIANQRINQALGRLPGVS